VLAQALNPQVAATTRAVLRNAAQVSRPGSAADPAVRDRYAELLVEPLRQLSSLDPDRDARVVANGSFAFMEQSLWSERELDEGDVDHLVQFLLRGAGVPET
jgi:hypothetical protein